MGRFIKIPNDQPIPQFCLPVIELSAPNYTYCYTLNTSADLDAVDELNFMIESFEETLIIIAISILKLQWEEDSKNDDSARTVIKSEV